jgi:putative ABC transport system permease protein
LLGIDGPVYRGKVRAGSLDELTGDTVALPPGVASRLKVGVGSEIGVRLGDDALVKVRVVALVEGPSGYEPLLLPSALLAAHTTAGMADQILVRTSSSSEDQVRSASEDQVRSALASVPGATVGSRDLLAAEYDAGLGVDAWIAYLLAGIAIAYAAIASINTIAVAVLDRRREFGLQRLTGSTRRQIGRMLVLESLVIAGFGLVLGLVAACFSILPIAMATRGWPLPSGPLWILPTWIAVVLLLVLPTTALAAHLAMRPRPMDAIST